MYRIDTQVFLSASGADGLLRFDAAMDMMQDCSVLWTESEPGFKRYLADNNLVMILANRQADVFRMPAYKERLAVETSIYECKGAFGKRNTVIYDESHAPCLTSWATGAFVGIDTARPFRLPPEITDAIVINPKIEMEYLDRRIAVPDMEGKTFPPIAVKPLDIDFNWHMNNGRYVKHAMGFLPDGFAISRFRVEYKKPAVKGNLLYPAVKESQGRIYVLLTDGEGGEYAAMEFGGASS
jgi:acyl-ACP thioesterase